MLVTRRSASFIKVSMVCKQESFQKKTGLQQKFNFVLDMYVVLTIPLMNTQTAILLRMCVL